MLPIKVSVWGICDWRYVTWGKCLGCNWPVTFVDITCMGSVVSV